MLCDAFVILVIDLWQEGREREEGLMSATVK
jgi:hypothetical protein